MSRAAEWRDRAWYSPDQEHGLYHVLADLAYPEMLCGKTRLHHWYRWEHHHGPPVDPPMAGCRPCLRILLGVQQP